MQRRVIKVNLMLLILIILLIISAIVCGIIFIPKLINKSKQNNEQQSSNQISANDEGKLSVHTQNGDIEFKTETNISELGYSMKYDIDWFNVDNSNIGEDCYVSSEYGNLVIKVHKETGNFDRRVSEIYYENYNTPYEPTSSNDIFEYRVTDERLNGSTEHVVKKHLKTKDIIQQEYYINGKDDEFFVIKLSCPMTYEADVFLIMEEMIKTFKIL